MASPFPAKASDSTSSTRKIRPGVELVDYRNAQGKVIAEDGEKNVLITSALPYVNNQPHLGNIIGSTLSADVFARYQRQRNARVLYVSPDAVYDSYSCTQDTRRNKQGSRQKKFHICGTDEYGTTTEVMAAKEGLGPQALCDKYHKLHAEAYEWFEIGFDHFGRTSTPKQTEICQDIFLKLYQNGWMEEHENQQLYCETDKRFLADRYVEGTCPKCGYDGARGDQCEFCSVTYESPMELVNPRCSACGSKPTARVTAHLHIKLKELQPKIEAWVEKASSEGDWSANGMAFTNGWLKGGLQSRGMTRDLEWGVKLPEELGEKWENKVMYVWFDAPIGYPSITANYTDEWQRWWRNPDNVKLYQFMGKDNVPFHTVLFPAYLLGTTDPWTMLHSISTTEYLQYEGTKFSKSKNVGVFGSNARETGVPASVWRYYLLQNRPETNDSEFTWDDFVAKANAELLNNLGNFVNRMIKFVIAKFDSVIPDPNQGSIDYATKAFPIPAKDQSFVNDINTFLTTFIDQMDHQKIRAGLQTVMQISSRGNQFIQDNHVDNALLASDPKRAQEVVLLVLNLIYVLGSTLHPFMPSTSDSIYRQLDATPRSIPDKFEIDLLPGHRLGQADYLFTRIDPKQVPIWRAQFGGGSAAKPADAATATGEAPLSKKAQQKAAKEAKKAAEAAAASAGPKSPEQLELEDKIKVQGDVVRKFKTGETKEGNVDQEVATLKGLKEELKVLTDKLKAAQI
ncbi:BZ3500_MvSof-1268-A1-R1_Chr9g10637 [Microbotryum saponariae]|uniref:methionine--tRNA ligase n=1 Tax=Microbotryum saponariae TaxID=289078 RepID=A0A2X0L6A4_9BASI|nr:BZ3501_MvSof-1269-A2-R1_Chr9g10385 [Microbotryum saponariae]SDA00430.1 BZ3500_MvSof-1268-A1-R1_Chr9g10637 [Microbotryum saponariae]